MKALFIANGTSMVNGVPGVTGGDMRWVSVARVWQKKGVDVHVLTTEAGCKFIKCVGLDVEIHDFGASGNSGKIANIDRGIHSYMVPKDLRNFDGIIYATTELMYDAIPGSIIRRRNPNSRLGVVSHWVAPLLRENAPVSNSVLFYVNNRLGLFYAKRYADVLFGVSGPTKRTMVEKIHVPEERIQEVACGVDYPAIRAVAVNDRKMYDAVFMKRLEGTKGVWDLLEIWKRVVEARPQSKLLILGSGSAETIEKINSTLQKMQIADKVTVYGPVYDFEKKISLLSQSRLFLLPTYEENWAIVIGEALAAGLPVICYDLPDIRPVWNDSISWVPKGDVDTFAREVIDYLNNPDRQTVRSAQGLEYVRRYDWEDIGEKELSALSALLPTTSR